MNAIDTNILVYAMRDPRDQVKQDSASHLVESLADAVLLWQVACEYVSVSRKLQAKGYGQSDPWNDITRFAKAWPLQIPSSRVLSRAKSLYGAYSLAVWDALLLAACVEANVRNLYTED